MNPRKVIIIDDERLARVELKRLLVDFPKLQVIAEASNADEGIRLIQSLKPDLVFLDIQMPEKSGFDMLEELEELPKIIFITAYDQYAIKAFEFNALDYLLKPIQTDRLVNAIERLFSSPAPIEPDKTTPLKSHVLLKDGDQSYFVKVSEVSLFSSYGNYVKVHFDGQSILVHRSLNQLEKRLSTEQFFRANRFSLININHIEEIRPIQRSKLVVTLRSGHEIQLSERKSVIFKDIWGI